MVEIRSSSLLLEQVGEIIEKQAGIIAETPHGTLFKAPRGGLGKKAIFLASGTTVENKKANCLGIISFLKAKGVPVRIWHELLDQEGAVIIDNLSLKQIELLNDYPPAQPDGI
ncbi:MAG: hypothetical protein WA001_03735 [Patescibacteria group bacterium]